MKIQTDNWKSFRLKDIAVISTGSTPPTKNRENFGDEYGFVTPGDICGTRFIKKTAIKLSNKGIIKTRLAREGSVLFVCIGSTIGKVAQIAEAMAYNQQINACTAKEGVDQSFFYYALLNCSSMVRRMAGTQAVPIVNKSTFQHIQINLPPIAEQRKIAEILSAQDRIIELKTKLLEEKKRLKKYLCQLIMGGNKLKLARGYSVRLLSSITKKKLIKNKDLKYSVVLSNSAKYGIVPQNVQFDKNIANEENIDRYYVAEIGDFIYKPRISTSAPCGPINQNDCCDGVVSPLYTVFSCSAECVCDKYLKYYFQTSLWHEYIQSVANTGARYDRMNVSDKDFFSMAINLPPLYTQRQCVVLLDAFSNVIKLMEENLEQEKLKKKALMQQLLTGKVRVTV